MTFLTTSKGNAGVGSVLHATMDIHQLLLNFCMYSNVICLIFAAKNYDALNFPVLPPCVLSQVVDVVSVSGLNQLLRENNMDKLKKTIYDVATHLHLGRDGQTCE